MKTRLLVGLAVLGLAACRATETSMPTESPSLAISDGAHANPGIPGNPDFFFLPPIVLPTSFLTNWNFNAFNGDLSPSLVLCQLDQTNPALITPATPCRAPAGGLPLTISGADVKKHFPLAGESPNPFANLEDLLAHYHAKYQVTSSCTKTYFLRVRVKVGTVELGFADVQCVTSILELLKVDYKKFGAVFRGTTLQIPFRIEKFALCPVPGVGPCTTATVDLAAGGTVNLVAGTQTVGGVAIPPQGGSPEPTTITVKPCTISSLPIDIPQYGTCLTILSDPLVEGENALTLPASVYDCTVSADPTLPGQPQLELVTLHRFRNGIVQALPHSGDNCTVSVGAASGSFSGLLAALTRGDWKGVGNQLFGLIAPKPLYARRLDVGAGGMSAEFSDFRFALPCKAVIVQGNNQIAAPGTLLPFAPTVKCTDLFGAPVAGATVKFQGDGVPAISLLTPSGAGQVSVPWMIPNAGANTLTASGRGIGGSDFNGPRGGGTGTANVDPFQPFPYLGPPTPESGTPSGPVELKTGSVVFTATGAAGDLLPINYGSGGWSYQIGGEPPATWFSSLVSPFSVLGTAGFGFFLASDNCSLIQSGVVTAWAPNTTLYIRRNIALGAPATIRISVAIDNDVEIFVDGVSVGPGLLTHEGCPSQGSFLRTVSLSAGTHVVAFRAVDRGSSSYFDASVTVVVPD